MSERIRNPYQPFSFSLNNFVQRKDIQGKEFFSYLRKRISEGTKEYNQAKHILLLGGAGTGKTWIVKKILSEKNRSEIHRMYFDMGNYHEDMEGFLSELMKNVGYLPSRQFELKGLLKSLSIGFPIGLSIIPGNVFTSRLPVSVDERLRETVAYLIKSAKKKKVFYILIFDQYGRISEIKGGIHIVRYLSFLVRECQKLGLSNILIIFSMRPERKGVLEFPFGSDVFNPEFVDRFSLGPFSREEAIEAIEKPLGTLGFKWRIQTVRSILKELRSFNPYFLQLSCYLIWNKISDNTDKLTKILSIPADQIKEVLSEGQSAIFKRFTNSQQEVLKVISQSHPIPVSQKQIGQRLESLGTEDLVGDLANLLESLTNNPDRPLTYIPISGGYRITHDLFADYILEKECELEAFDVAVLQGILDYAYGLFRVAGFMFTEDLLDRLWSNRLKLRFSKEVFHTLALSIINLEEDKWELHFQWFSSLKAKFTESLITLSKSDDTKTRKGAIRAMGLTLDNRCCKAMISNLSDENTDIREETINALSFFRDESAVEENIISSLRDSDQKVRNAAALALGKIRSQKALPALEQILKKDEESSVKKQAVQAIVKIGGDEAFNILKNAIQGKSKENRMLAIEYIIELDHDSVTKSLLNQLRAKDPDIRRRVIESLGIKKSEEAVKYLRNLVNDKLPEVAKAAVKSLANIKNNDAISALINALSSPYPHLRFLSYSFLKVIPNSLALEQIKLMPKDPSYAKIFKMRLLASIGNDAAFDLLCLFEKEEDEEVLAHFVRSLAYFNRSWILPFLTEFLKHESPVIRKAAIEVISKVELIELHSDVQRLRNDDNKSIRWLAKKIVGERHGNSKNGKEREFIKISNFAKEIMNSGKQIYNAQKRLIEKILSFPTKDRLPPGPISALTSEDPMIRSCALQMYPLWGNISENDEDLVFKIIYSFVSDPDIKNQVVAVSIHPFAYRDIISNQSKHPLVRIAAIGRLNKTETSYLEELIDLLGMEEYWIRRHLLRVLSSSRKAGIYKRLVEAIQPKNDQELFISLLDLYNIQNESLKVPRLTYYRSGDETLQCEKVIETEIKRLHRKAMHSEFLSELLNLKHLEDKGNE